MMKLIINYYCTRVFPQNWFNTKYMLLLVFLKLMSGSFRLILLYCFSLLNNIVPPIKIAQISAMEKHFFDVSWYATEQGMFWITF